MLYMNYLVYGSWPGIRMEWPQCPGSGESHPLDSPQGSYGSHAQFFSLIKHQTITRRMGLAQYGTGTP
jgi:hypothetical protein